MAKDQLKIKAKKNIACIKTFPGQEINNREMADLNAGVQGFLTPAVEVGKKNYKLFYDLSDTLSLREFFAVTVLTKKIFGSVMASIEERLRTAENFHFDKSLIQYSVDRIFIRTVDWKIVMIYVPLRPYAAYGSYFDLLQDITRYATFDPGEDTSYVKEFFDIISSESSFSIYRLEDYLNSLTSSPKKSVERTIKCSYCNTLISEGESKCPACGHKVALAGLNDSALPVHNNVQTNEFLFSNESESNGICIENEPMEDINADNYVARAMFKLISKRTGESVNVYSLPFSIGKLNDNALRINDGLVSRKHAEIITVGDRLYVHDLGSTNGTFVNGNKVEPGLSARLTHGASVCFAREEYIVNMEE